MRQPKLAQSGAARGHPVLNIALVFVLARVAAGWHPPRQANADLDNPPKPGLKLTLSSPIHRLLAPCTHAPNPGKFFTSA